MFTVIIRMDTTKYHVGLCDDPLVYLKTRKKKGFFNQKGNDKGELVFMVEGDYKDKIRSFGGRLFMQLIDAYDPELDGLHQILQ